MKENLFESSGQVPETVGTAPGTDGDASMPPAPSEMPEKVNTNAAWQQDFVMPEAYEGYRDEHGEPLKPIGLLQALTGVITSPVLTFRRLSVKPFLLWPLMVLLGLTVLTTVLSLEPMEAYTRQALETSMMTNPQVAEVMTPEMFESQVSMSMKMVLFISPLMVLVTPILKGLLSHGMAKVFAGRGKMKASLAVVTLAYFIMVVGGLLKLPLMMMSNTVVTFSPAMLLPAEQAASPLASFLMNFDLFTLWYLGASAIGIREVHRISTWKAAWSVLLPYGIVLLLSASSLAISVLMGNA